MKSLNRAAVSVFVLFLGTPVFADLTTKKLTLNPKITQSLGDYKVCDVDALANQLGKQFAVAYLPDERASYNYYLVTNSSNMNADKIRGAVCQFVMDNTCYLYWGNVANLAMFSQQKAAWFPADTSPHYMLSPIITCDKLATKK